MKSNKNKLSDNPIIIILLVFCAISSALWFVPHIIESQKTSEIKFSLYSTNENGEMIIYSDENKYDIYVDDNAIAEKQVIIPINIAFVNTGKKSAELEYVILTYDSKLNVSSNSTKLVNSIPGKLTLKHNMEALHPTEGDSYIPLKDPDYIYLSMKPLFLFTPAITKDGVPMYWAGLSIEFENKEIEFNLELVGKNMKPIKNNIIINLLPNFEYIYPPHDTNVIFEDVEDISFNFSNKIIIDNWCQKIDNDNTINYTKYSYDSTNLVQLIYVKNQLRRIIIDNNGDEIIDEDYVDTTFDGVLDKKIIYSVKPPLLDWVNPNNYSIYPQASSTMP